MKNIWLIIAVLFWFQFAHAQENICGRDFFLNDSIKFTFHLVTPMANNLNKLNSGIYFISIPMKRICFDWLNNQKFSFWLPKLKDTNSDWASNIALYAIYQRPADKYYTLFTSRSKWILYKETEILNWRDFFQKRKEKKFE